MTAGIISLKILVEISGKLLNISEGTPREVSRRTTGKIPGELLEKFQDDFPDDSQEEFWNFRGKDPR